VTISTHHRSRFLPSGSPVPICRRRLRPCDGGGADEPPQSFSRNNRCPASDLHRPCIDAPIMNPTILF
jgi:hypothetical protein